MNDKHKPITVADLYDRLHGGPTIPAFERMLEVFKAEALDQISQSLVEISEELSRIRQIQARGL